MEFQNFKFFKTNYKFSKSKSKQYFDNALLSGCGVYIDEIEKERDERIHIAFSWMELFKYLSYILLAICGLLMLKGVDFDIIFIIFNVSIIVGIIKYILHKKIQNILTGYDMNKLILTVDSYKYLELVRQNLIKERELQKN